MKKCLLIAVVLALPSCAITSGTDNGPNGRPVHWINGTSAKAAFEKASALCPSGYDILGDPKQTSVIDYEMTIECK
jgi:hypothetical protein